MESAQFNHLLPNLRINLQASTAANLNTINGIQAELMYDTTNKVIRVFDGLTKGGFLAGFGSVESVAISTSTAITRFNTVCFISATGAITVTLPVGTQNEVHIFKDFTGTAGTDNITLTASGSDVFEGGGTTKVMNSNYQNVKVIYNLGVWSII